MNIKNLLRIAPIVLLLAITFPAAASSIYISSTHHAVKTINNDSMRVEQIIARVTEIQNMDIANLSPNEKKDLKKELKQLKKEATAMADYNRGIYLSVGAVIIIILLLILILR